MPKKVTARIDTSETGVKKVGLFDYVSALGETKVNLLEQDPENEKGFNCFMTALAFSQHLDTVLYANEANLRGHMSKRMTHDFYFHAVPAARRSRAWAKAQKLGEDIEFLAKSLRCSRRRAAEDISLIPQDEMDSIRRAFTDTGGMKKR